MYPTLEEVERADREQICRWWQTLKWPAENALIQPDGYKRRAEHTAIMVRIRDRFLELDDLPVKERGHGL